MIQNWHKYINTVKIFNNFHVRKFFAQYLAKIGTMEFNHLCIVSYANIYSPNHAPRGSNEGQGYMKKNLFNII